MSKFNPEDFKAPEMEPLSNVTIDGYNVEWDKTADGLIGMFKGVAVRMEGERAFVRVGGDFTDTPVVETDLEMEDGDIKLGVAMIGVGKISDIDPEIFNKEMKGGFAEDMPLICTEQNLDVDLNKMNGSRMQMVGKISDPSGTKADCGEVKGVTVEAKPLLTRPKAQPYGTHSPRDPKVRDTTQRRLSNSVEMDELAGKAAEIDPDLFNEPTTDGFMEDTDKISDPSGAKAECGSRMQMASRPLVFCRECSCKSCGAPVSFYRVDTKTFVEAKHKGKAPRNFTDEELESIFGDFGEIDGVIYDDSRLCSQCRSYEC